MTEPAKEEAIWANWQVLSELPQAAEARLLRRIAAKSEEIRSLRDGALFSTLLFEGEDRAVTSERFKS
ncbi:hypothetical protein VTI74DRAFT_7337 [Chaetomium olivicolor]